MAKQYGKTTRGSSNFLQTSRNIMFHDYDLAAIDGGLKKVQRIMREPEQTDGPQGWYEVPSPHYDGQSLLNWSSLNSNGVFYSVRYDGVIEDEPFLEWVGRCKEKAIYSQMEYHITPSRYDPNEFIEHLLPKNF